jgi:sarcosine oxidase
MDKSYDVIVVGVGGMGSAACWQLARRGKRVLGIERFDIGHANGSSHGVNRIIRLAYFEHPDYVPLLRRAYHVWRETEAAFGEQLLYITGSIDAGPEGSRVVDGSLASCRTHDLAHEAMDADALRRRFPGWQLPSGYRAVFQPEGGFVASERAIAAHVMLALAAGADIHARETVTGFEVRGGGVRVTTTAGAYEARRVVLSAGAWLGDLVPTLRLKAVPERQVIGWFAPRTPQHFAPDRFPVGNLASEHGHYYVLPQWGLPGVKIGRYHHLCESGHADTLSRDTGPRDTFALRRGLRAFFPDADGPVLSLRACMFTNTPDEHFIIDSLPGVPEVIVASPCSGHGFKFASVIGEILADLAEGRSPAFDLSLFKLDRFAAAA